MRICIEIDEDRAHHRTRLDFVKLGPVRDQLLPPFSGARIMILELLDSQDCAVTVAAVDKKGKPATVQTPVWTSSDDTAATVTADATDPLKAVISAQAPGVARITCTADADLGDGVSEISATLDVSVVGGVATGFTITPGVPTEQP